MFYDSFMGSSGPYGISIDILFIWLPFSVPMLTKDIMLRPTPHARPEPGTPNELIGQRPIHGCIFQFSNAVSRAPKQTKPHTLA